MYLLSGEGPDELLGRDAFQEPATETDASVAPSAKAGIRGKAQSSAASQKVLNAVAAADEAYQTRIYQVNEEFNFVVLSTEGMNWIEEGMNLLIEFNQQPVATIELTELDNAGFAVGQLLTQDPIHQLQKGDIVTARHVLD